jgi:hypothetical protein
MESFNVHVTTGSLSMYNLSGGSLPNLGTTIQLNASVNDRDIVRSAWEAASEGKSDSELSPPASPFWSVKIHDVWSSTWTSNMISLWFFPFWLLEWTTLKI